MDNSINTLPKTTSTPFIEGNTATFMWKGRNPPLLEGDFTGWDMRKRIRLIKREPGLWTYPVYLPSDAYIEYVFRRGEVNILDPLNPRKISNGIGGYNNYFSMPDYEPTTLDRNGLNIQHGIVTKHILPTDYLLPSNKRIVHLYHPPVSEPVPLVVVWDGQDYYRRLKLNLIVDNLIFEKRIQPLALAFINNGGPKNRTVEYACSEATLVFLMSEVIPLAKKELNIIKFNNAPGVFGVMGASMGGLMALYTGIRLPQVFGKVLSQSGAFSWADLDMVVFDLLQHDEIYPIKIWMDVGNYDLAGLLDVNRRMKTLLEEKGYPLTYHEYNAGHNYPAWRDDIWRGLETLYGVGIK